jgi:response regulator RpfG family c-di-GMP phosphodiesterase
MSSLVHLVRRFVTSLSRQPPSASETAWALGQLLKSEAELWQQMTVQDRRHSILVARRFLECAPDASRPEVAAALLHDIGKLASGLGTLSRVAATIVGPRTNRFEKYHDHERLGAEMLAAVGSATVTVELVCGRGDRAQALRHADDI